MGLVGRVGYGGHGWATLRFERPHPFPMPLILPPTSPIHSKKNSQDNEHLQVKNLFLLPNPIESRMLYRCSDGFPEADGLHMGPSESRAIPLNSICVLCVFWLLCVVLLIEYCVCVACGCD